MRRRGMEMSQTRQEQINYLRYIGKDGDIDDLFLRQSQVKFGSVPATPSMEKYPTFHLVSTYSVRLLIIAAQTLGRVRVP
jgi:hypothetical protein